MTSRYVLDVRTGARAVALKELHYCPLAIPLVAPGFEGNPVEDSCMIIFFFLLPKTNADISFSLLFQPEGSAELWFPCSKELGFHRKTILSATPNAKRDPYQSSCMIDQKKLVAYWAPKPNLLGQHTAIETDVSSRDINVRTGDNSSLPRCPRVAPIKQPQKVVVKVV